MAVPDRDRLADVLAGEVSRPRHDDELSVTFDNTWPYFAARIRAALADGTLSPEDLGMKEVVLQTAGRREQRIVWEAPHA